MTDKETNRNAIKAIETRYLGYRFRSRLEARWAVFFNQLGVKFEYEPQGFDLPSGLYLPDFFLPDVRGGLWIEIKPTDPSGDEKSKMSDLVKATGFSGSFRVGEPLIGVNIANGDAVSSDYDNAGIFVQEGWDTPYLFCVCPWCGKVGFEFDGRGARVCGYESHYEKESDALDAIRHLGHHRADDKCYTGNCSSIFDAAICARSARFEHGESGYDMQKA